MAGTGWELWYLGNDARVYGGGTGECGFDTAGADSWANSPVQDAGPEATYYVTITHQEARGTYQVKFRHDTSSFHGTDTSPSWETYTPGNQYFKYIQARIDKLS